MTTSKSSLYGLIYLVISLGLLHYRGQFRYSGILAGDAPSYYYFNFAWPDGLLGSFRNFVYPVFIKVLIQLKFPFEMLPILQCSLYLIAIWLVFQELRKRFPFIILVPFLITASQGPHIGYFSDIQNEALSMVFWLLGFYLMLRKDRFPDKRFLYVISGTLFGISIIERSAYLGPTLIILLFAVLLGSNSKFSLSDFKSKILIGFSIVVVLLAFILLKQITIGKPSISNYSGALLVGHAALLDSKNELQTLEIADSRGKIWVEKARIHLDEPCKELRKYNMAWNKLKESYSLQNQCFLPIMMATWNQAIFETTGNLPLKESEPIEKQIQAWKYTWPNSNSLSLSKYHSENWSLYIDGELLRYSLKVIYQNWPQYLVWLASGTLFDFFHYLSWPELITRHLSISFIQSLSLAVIWSLYFTYFLFKRKQSNRAQVLSAHKKFLLLSIPIIFMISIYASILPVLYSVARYVVIWFPILFFMVPITSYLIFRDFLHTKYQKTNRN